MKAERCLHQLSAFPLQREAGYSEENLCFEILRRMREVTSAPPVFRKTEGLLRTPNRWSSLCYSLTILFSNRKSVKVLTDESHDP